MHNLKLVTFSGADETVKQKDILQLAEESPNTEWGILLSKSNEGHCSRYPSLEWIYKLIDLSKLNLSGHIQGKWLRELICYGDFSFVRERPKVWKACNRIQLNFHGERLDVNWNFITELKKYPDKQFIFQLDGVNTELFVQAYVKGVNAVPLFDLSQGQGILPREWPKPLAKYNGYAGGLGPDTIEEQLPKIIEAAGDTDMWLDMETGIRNGYFDLNKCRQVLEIVRATKTRIVTEKEAQI